MKARWGFMSVGLALLTGGCSGGNLGSGCVVDQFTTAGQRDMGIGDHALGGNSVAQSFTLGAQARVSGVSVSLYKKGTISDNYPVTLTVEGGASSPNGALAATNATSSIKVQQITTTPSFLRFAFSGTITLEPGTYWIRVTGGYPIDPAPDTNLVKWEGHDDTDGYTGGHAMYLDGSSVWSTNSIGVLRDLLFIIHC